MQCIEYDDMMVLCDIFLAETPEVMKNSQE